MRLLVAALCLVIGANTAQAQRKEDTKAAADVAAAKANADAKKAAAAAAGDKAAAANVAAFGWKVQAVAAYEKVVTPPPLLAGYMGLGLSNMTYSDNAISDAAIDRAEGDALYAEAGGDGTFELSFQKYTDAAAYYTAAKNLFDDGYNFGTLAAGYFQYSLLLME